MTERKAIHILNRGDWQQYLDKENMPMEEWLQLQEAINTALEALAIQAAIKAMAWQIRSE